jgi:ferric-dicitrate binding protein FerR (iron transport regulator)
MSSAAASSALGSEFDAFLFASLGEDRNGVPLSVVSLLARMNLDPWQEAGDLAALPAEAAASRLAGSLDSLTDPLLRHANANSRTLALRLLILLPRKAPAVITAPAAAPAPVTVRDVRARIVAIIVIMAAIALLGSQIIAAHRLDSRAATSAAPSTDQAPW